MQEMQEAQVQSLSWEDPLEKGMATHSSILTWRIPWTEEPGGLQFIGSQRWPVAMQVKKKHLKPNMKQQTGSKLGKVYAKAVYCHSAYLTYMQSTSWEMLGWMTHKLE